MTNVLLVLSRLGPMPQSAVGILLLLALILCSYGCYSATTYSWQWIDYYNPAKFSTLPTREDTIYITNNSVLVFGSTEGLGPSFEFGSIIVDRTGSLVLINTNLTLSIKLQLGGRVTVSNSRLETPRYVS